MAALAKGPGKLTGNFVPAAQLDRTSKVKCTATTGHRHASDEERQVPDLRFERKFTFTAHHPQISNT